MSPDVSVICHWELIKARNLKVCKDKRKGAHEMYMKNLIKSYFIQRRRKKVSQITLRDIIPKCEKSRVLDYAEKFLSDNFSEDFIKFIINDSEDYHCPLLDRSHLECGYNNLLSLCNKEYSHKDINEFSIGIGFGFPFGFDEFISLSEIDENLESTVY